jgi:hypothetical protein
MSDSVKYPQAKVKLVGEDGNAFAIIGRVRKALRKAEVSQEEIEAATKELTSCGSYNELLVKVMDLVDCDSEEGKDNDWS